MRIPKAEEQVHEEVAERRGGIKRAGGGGGLLGRALRGIRSPAEGRDAGSLDGSPSSNKVTESLQTIVFVPFCVLKKAVYLHLHCSRDFAVFTDFYSSCLGPKAWQSLTMRSAEPSPR